MARKLSFFVFLVGTFINGASSLYAQEKVKLGTPVKTDPGYYLVIWAAEEKGFWKDNGLDVEWVPFAGGTPLMQAVAARAINIAMHVSSEPPAAAERGLPVVMVAELTRRPFFMWVRTESPYRHPREMKGARVGVSSLGSAEHNFGRLILAAQGVEKEVRFVGSGGIPQTLAGMRVGAFDAMVLSVASVSALKAEGIIREIASSHDYVPKPWFDHTVLVRKDFAGSKPEVIRKMLKATLQASDFVRKYPAWSVNKIKGFHGISDEIARLVYEKIEFSVTGRIDRKAVENIRRLFMEYGVLTEKAPAVDDLFTNEYLPG